MHKSFDTPGPVTLELRIPSGEIEVEPTLEGRVEVELIAHDEESQALVDAARVEQHGDHIHVEVPQKRGGFGFQFLFGRSGISCRVKCPPSSNLEVRSKSADVSARGTLGNVGVNTASGEVELRTVDGNLGVKSASGDIQAERVGGNASVHTASGDVVLGFVGGLASVNAVSGDVRIGEALSDTNVTTVSGDQQHEAVFAGNVTAQSVSGDVLVAVRRGAKVYLDCNTLSGDTSSELDMTGEPGAEGPLIEIRVKTVSGDITITRAPAPADSAQEVHA
jgi:putative adhesin